MRSTAKKKNKYGNVNIPEEAFEPRNVKIRVTTLLDLDVLNEIKKRAKEEGIGYQTWMNRTFREVVLKEPSLQSRMDRFEDTLKELVTLAEARSDSHEENRQRKKRA